MEKLNQNTRNGKCRRWDWFLLRSSSRIPCRYIRIYLQEFLLYLWKGNQVESFFSNVTWQLTLHICPHGSFVSFVLYFVLNSLHGEAGFIAAIKTLKKKRDSPTRSSFHRGFDCFHLTALICFGINVCRVKTPDYCSLFYPAPVFMKYLKATISFRCCGFVSVSECISGLRFDLNMWPPPLWHLLHFWLTLFLISSSSHFQPTQTSLQHVCLH